MGFAGAQPILQAQPILRPHAGASNAVCFAGKEGGKYGWQDDKGRVWCPTGPGRRAHGGPHWDVQLPGGGYVNVRPGQNINDF
ncbi:polymorphic toxin type 37 domain-containing protein [Bradyrhizobium betae]